MALNTIFQRASDEVARDATITIGIGTDPGDDDYAPTSLVDDNPAKVAKIDSTTGAWDLDFGSAQRIDLVALIHHDFDAGANVKFQGFSSDPGGSPGPSAAIEASITIPAWLGSGTSAWPVNAWKDLTGESGYTTTGYRYWRLIVTGNSQNLQLGQLVCCSTIRTLDPDLRWDYVRSVRKPNIFNRTAFEVDTIYTRGTSVWRLEADLRQDDTLLSDLEAHWYDADGQAKPFLAIPSPPDSASTGSVERRPYLVRYDEDNRSLRHHAYDVHDMRLILREVGRGLRPGV